MESIYILIPVTFVLLGLSVAAWVWSVRNEQFDDLDKAARSILLDDPVDRQTRSGSTDEQP